MVKEPACVVGDLHGQYYDLLKVLEVGGKLPEMQYIFLGDYGDRGSFAVETCLLVFVLKVFT